VISVLVVDDIQLIRERLSAILSESSDVVVVAEASNGWEAIERARKYQPDVVLLDISMPQLNGLQAAPLIKQAAPAAQILVVTQHNSHFFIRAAFAVGVLGFMEKKNAGTELLNAVKDVFSKKMFVSRGLQFSFDSPTTPL
jgi:DNA-binding NarL/FixJ family response regulator